MPASQEQKVDFLLKKIGYSASKTGIAEDESTISSSSNTAKKPFEEGIPSPLIIPQSSLWADSGSGVPRNAAPGCASGIVMSGSSGTFKCVFGTESSSNATSPYRILIRWRLDAADSITAMSYTTT